MKKIASTLLFLTTFLTLSSASDLTYEVDLTKSTQNIFHVKFLINNVEKRDTIEISMASWTPGSYKIREFAQHLYNETAYYNTEVLALTKTNKNTWEIVTNGSPEIIFEYSIYAHDLSVRNSYINDELALINGASVFTYVRGRENEAVELKLILPEKWDKVSTTLNKVDKKKFVYSANNLDELIDSPVLIGTHEIHEFIEQGVNHQIAITGPKLYDLEKIEQDIRKIIKSQTEIFQDNPNEDYIFFIINHERGGGGLEHKSSCVVVVDRFAYTKQSSYESFLSLIAHEYFHLWNVKRIRPIELGPFDYDSENYTSLLWIMEGFTEYFTEKTLYRIGLNDARTFLASINNVAQNNESKPGNDVQSLGEASFDAWIKYYHRDENDYNTEISYYDKGMLAGAMLDFKIIADSKGEKSLDDVMSQLYQTYYKSENRGFTKEEFIKTLNDVSGSDNNQFIENHVYDTTSFQYEDLLKPFGVEVSTVEQDNSTFGFYARQSGSGYKILRIVSGSPAYYGGLNVDDEIVAIEGYKFNPGKQSYFEQKLTSGESITFTILRYDLLKEISLKSNSGKSRMISFGIKSDRNEDEKKLWDVCLNK